MASAGAFWEWQSSPSPSCLAPFLPLLTFPFPDAMTSCTGSTMLSTIQSLGPCVYPSPLHAGGLDVPFRTDAERVIVDHQEGAITPEGMPKSFEMAGPREKIFFDPPKTTAAIVTCGGLCPGLNDIIKGIVTQCHYRYGVTKVFGFRYGYEGLIQRYGHVRSG